MARRRGTTCQLCTPASCALSHCLIVSLSPQSGTTNCQLPPTVLCTALCTVYCVLWVSKPDGFVRAPCSPGHPSRAPPTAPARYSAGREARALRAPAGVPGRIWARDLDGALDVLAGWRLSRAPGPRDATREIRLLRKRPDALLAPLDRARRPAAGGGGALGRSAPDRRARGDPGRLASPGNRARGAWGPAAGWGGPGRFAGPRARAVRPRIFAAWRMKHGAWSMVDGAGSM